MSILFFGCLVIKLLFNGDDSGGQETKKIKYLQMIHSYYLWNKIRVFGIEIKLECLGLK